MGETKKRIGKHTRPAAGRAARVARATRAGGILAVVVTAGAVMAACSSSSDPVAAKPTCGGSAPKLTVQGTGLATGTPNILTISVDINVTDATANEALSDDNTRAAAVTAALALGG